jgi:hypothetical protein
MTQPSVGRIVHYMARGSADGVFPVTCRAAIVTEVDEDTCGLAVMHPDGLLFARDISEGAPLNVAAVGGTWHWPERV